MLTWLSTTSWGAEPSSTHRADHRKAHCTCPNRLIENLQDFCTQRPLDFLWKQSLLIPFLDTACVLVFLFSLLSMWGPGYLYYSKIDTGHVILKSMTIPLVLLTFRNRIFSPDHTTKSHFSFPVLLPKHSRIVYVGVRITGCTEILRCTWWAGIGTEQSLLDCTSTKTEHCPISQKQESKTKTVGSCLWLSYKTKN